MGTEINFVVKVYEVVKIATCLNAVGAEAFLMQ